MIREYIDEGKAFPRARGMIETGEIKLRDSSLISEFLSLVQVHNFEDTYSKDIVDGKYFGMPLKSIVEAEKRLRLKTKNSVAYFSMEYGLATGFYNKFSSSRNIDPRNYNQGQEVFSNFRLADYFFTVRIDSLIDMPLYSGGLGVLAGDTIKTMADYKLPAVAIGMLWSSGYFRQRFWFKYGQMPEKMHWDPYSYPGIVPLENIVKISLKEGDIYLRLWKYYVYSYKRDYVVPLILLDSNVDQNTDKYRHLTDQLYRSDNVWIKIMQRVILGMGGVAALNTLGYNIDIYHLNEGHAIFAFVEKIRGLPEKDLDNIKRCFVYTCHTPVSAGHDRFSRRDVGNILKKEDYNIVETFGQDKDNLINLTLFSIRVSSGTNAVSKSHQKVMHRQFPKFKNIIKSVTNGVHPYTWISDRIISVFEKFSYALGDIKSNPAVLAEANRLRDNQEFRRALWDAHQSNKYDLCQFLAKWKIKKDIFTVCWARRVAAYKRPSMILQDVERLIDITRKRGPLQIIFAGKAHPNDDLGFTFINEMLDKVDRLAYAYDDLRILMLENYEIGLARLLTSGVDIWLNNPLPPFEASGTSGMKAILNGVLQLSTVDGWVAEVENKNIGRFFGYRSKNGTLGDEHDLHIKEDAQELYKALDEMAELYYRTNKDGKTDIFSSWIDMMIDCLVTSTKFNTYRMLDDYKHKIWNLS